MDFTSFKRAAKRLHQFAPSYFGDGQQHWQLSDSQTLLARALNFRDVHEAEVRLSQRDVLSRIRFEPGGLVSPSKAFSNPVESLLRLSGATLAVEARPGSGKTYLAHEVIVQSLLLGRRVRVVDWGGSYRRLAALLGGIFLVRPDQDAWQSPAELVVLDAEQMHAKKEQVNFAALRLEGDALFLCDEYWQFQREYVHPGCQTMLFAMSMEDFAGVAPDAVMQKDDLVWNLQLPGGARLPFVMANSPWREAVYSTHPAVMKELGMNFDRERFETFVARKNKL